jgi:hypothetical protein
MLLYILPFKSNEYFKIGIAKSNNRIYSLDSIYSIDFDKCLIFEGDNKFIKLTERILLTEFEPIKSNPFTTDGRTEIREIKHFNKVVKRINQLSKIYNFKKYTIQSKIKSIYNKSRIPKEYIDIVLNENKESLDWLNNIFLKRILDLKNNYKIEYINHYYDSKFSDFGIKISDIEFCDFKNITDGKLRHINIIGFGSQRIINTLIYNKSDRIGIIIMNLLSNADKEILSNNFPQSAIQYQQFENNLNIFLDSIKNSY